MRHSPIPFLFLLLVLATGPLARGLAQSVPLRTSLDVVYQPGDSLLTVEALLQPPSWEPGDTLSWLLHQGQVRSVHLVQGRIKEALAYRQKKESLQIVMPAQAKPSSNLLVRYHYPLFPASGSSSPSPLLRKGDDWAIHWINWNSSEPLGWAGSFFPARKHSPIFLQVNITVPRSTSVHTLGELDFSVEQTEGFSYFYSSSGPVYAEEFYLAVGNWQAPESDTREEMLAQHQEEVRSLKVEGLRQNLAPFTEYILSRKAYALADEDLEGILQMPHIGASFPLNLPAQADSSNFAHQQQLALLVAGGDTALAAQWHYSYWRKKKGSAWEAQLLDSLLRPDTSLQPPFWWDQYLQRFLESRNLRWADTSNLPSSKNLQTADQAALSIAQVAQKQRQRIPLTLSFRYRRSSEQLFLFLQSDSLNNQAQVPLELEIHTAQQVLRRAVLAPLHGKDTLPISLGESPRSVYVHRGDYSPVHLELQRPQAWYLYDLSRAPAAWQQRRALDFLLENAGPHLQSTVVGIALDSSNPALRLKALRQISRLSPEGREKWKSRIQELAKEKQQESVQKRAIEVLEKNYP